MPRLDRQLERVTRQIQRRIAPGVGADIVEVWRAGTPTGPLEAGGTHRDAAGNVVRTAGSGPAPATAGRAFHAAYYCRAAPQLRNATETDSGQITSVVPEAFVFNAGDRPDVVGSDALRIAVKRTANQTLAQMGWQAGYLYQTGALEQPTRSNGRKYKRSGGAISGPTEPVWPLSKGQTVSDGDGFWTCLGESVLYQVTAPGGYDTHPGEIVVIAERKGQMP